jgi:hypothetical protein
VSNHRHSIERFKKKALIGLELERIGHKSAGVRDHAVG